MMKDQLFSRMSGSTSRGLMEIEVKMSFMDHFEIRDFQNNFEVMEQYNRFIDAVNHTLIKSHPDTVKEVADERKTILSFFKEPIYVEEIANQYSNSGYHRCYPWYKITTEVGHFIVGRRKRVYSIDWSQTTGSKIDPKELFKDEETTIDNALIHAWSEKDARRYIELIVAARKGL